MTGNTGGARIIESLKEAVAGNLGKVTIDGHAWMRVSDYEKLKDERDEYNEFFDFQWKADQRAIARWRAGHPGKEAVWPDRTDMVLWLIERLEQLEGRANDDS